MSNNVREAAEALLDILAKIEDAPNRYIAAAMKDLRSALAAPVPAPTRDAVADVLLHEAHPDLAPWSLLQLSGPNAAGIVCAVALARRQADAVMARWPGAATGQRDEAVAWAVVNRFDTYINFDTDRGNVERFHERLSRHPADDAPYRVVALVPQRGAR